MGAPYAAPFYTTKSYLLWTSDLNEVILIFNFKPYMKVQLFNIPTSESAKQNMPHDIFENWWGVVVGEASTNFCCRLGMELRGEGVVVVNQGKTMHGPPKDLLWLGTPLGLPRVLLMVLGSGSLLGYSVLTFQYVWLLDTF